MFTIINKNGTPEEIDRGEEVRIPKIESSRGLLKFTKVLVEKQKSKTEEYVYRDVGCEWWEIWW